MLVVWRRRQNSGPDEGTPFPPPRPVETPAIDGMEGGEKCDTLERGQMDTRAYLRAVLRGRVQPSGDGLPSGF